MQTKRSYFFAGALGGGAENVKQTKKHLAHGTEKIKTRLFLYPFSEIAAGNIPVWAKIKLLRCTFGKRGTKIVRTFFRRTLCAMCRVKIMRGGELGLCRVPRKKILERGFIVLPGKGKPLRAALPPTTSFQGRL